MGIGFLKITVVCLRVGALLGLVMGISQQFPLAPMTAHLLLPGWAPLALAGLAALAANALVDVRARG